jgi:hypothetical protein
LDYNGAKIAYPWYLMQQAQQIYYTINAGTLLSQSGNPVFEGNQDICLNLLLDIQPSQCADLLNLLNKRGSEFLFSLSSHTVKDAEQLKALLPACYLLASLHLYAAGDAAFIPVLCEQPAGELQTGLLQAYFDEQGIASLQTPVLNKREAGIHQATCCSFMVHNMATPPDMYESIPVLPAIIVFEPTPANPVTWNELAGQLQSGIMLAAEARPAFEQKRCETEISRWQKRALLYRQFLQLSKQVQEQEYYEVIDWYNHEYEILPLWYKRFGHIIKVLMGKRSFRSLFSDNVKKYKD